jgi:hypothetical protein
LAAEKALEEKMLREEQLRLQEEADRLAAD